MDYPIGFLYRQDRNHILQSVSQEGYLVAALFFL